jgi:mutator family transposase
LLKESLLWVVQRLMEAEVSELIGAERGERSAERLTHRNGYRQRVWSTRAGEIELAIPKMRRGTYFPSFLEPRKRSERALVAVVQEAYVAGVSTRKVDQLVESLGLRISKSEVSRICAGLDEQVEAFRNRPLEGLYPYLWLDAKDEQVRDGGRVVPKALVPSSPRPEQPTIRPTSYTTPRDLTRGQARMVEQVARAARERQKHSPVGACSANGASNSRPETWARHELDLFVNGTQLVLNSTNRCIGGYLRLVQPHHLLRPLVLHSRTLERERVAVAAIAVGSLPTQRY